MVTLHDYHLADVPGAAVLSTWDFQACIVVTLHGYHLADIPGAAILSTWDFQACVVVTLHGYHLADIPGAAILSTWDFLPPNLTRTCLLYTPLFISSDMPLQSGSFSAKLLLKKVVYTPTLSPEHASAICSPFPKEPEGNH